jgi:ribosomal protein L24E
MPQHQTTARTKTAKHTRSFNSKGTLVVVGDNSVCGYYFLNKKCLITNKHSEKPRQFRALIWGNGKSQVTGIESGFKSQRVRHPQCEYVLFLGF